MNIPTSTTQPISTSTQQITPKTSFSELPQELQTQLKSFHEKKQIGRLKFEAQLKQNQRSQEAGDNMILSDDVDSYILLELEAIESKTEKLSQKLETIKHSMSLEEREVEDLKQKVSEQVKDVEHSKATLLSLQAPSASRSIHAMSFHNPQFSSQIGTRSSSKFFFRVAQQLEQRMHNLWKQLEDIENTLEVPERNIPASDMLRESLQYQQAAFLKTASAVSKIHEDVSLLRETFKSRYVTEGRDPFSKPKPAKKGPYSFTSGATSRTVTLPGISVPEPEGYNTQPTTNTGFGSTSGFGASTGGFGSSSNPSGFNFGTSGSGGNTATNTGGFNFGGSGSSSGSGFNFGNPSGASGSSGFNFGSAGTGTTSTSNTGGSGIGSINTSNTSGTTGSTGGFNFGGSNTSGTSSSTGSTGGFNFGTSSTTPSSGTGSGFSFGGSNSTQSGASGGGFNFGSTSGGTNEFVLGNPPSKDRFDQKRRRF